MKDSWGWLGSYWGIFEGFFEWVSRFLIPRDSEGFWGILRDSEGFKWILRDPWFCLKSYWGILYIGNFGWIVKKIGNNLAKINFNFEDISVKNEEQIDNFGVFYFWKLFLPIFVIFTKNWKFWINCSKIGNNLAKINFNFGDISVKNEEKIGNFGVFFYFWRLFLPIFVIIYQKLVIIWLKSISILGIFQFYF